MRRQAMKAKQAYDKFYRVLEDRIAYELDRPPQGGRGLHRIEAEMRAMEHDSVRLAISDEQFAERLTNMWANVAQAELAAEAAERELQRLPGVSS
jgi:hypothetical protein